MRMINRIAPSRQNKRQIIAFLPSEDVDFIHQTAISTGTTIQELLAHVLNKSIELSGSSPVLLPEHFRIVRKKTGRSQPKTKETTPNLAPSRVGKRSISGWYPKERVLEISKIAEENNTSIQKMIAKGVEYLKQNPI